MSTRLVIIGSGGHGKDLLSIVEACNKEYQDHQEFEFLGFLDDYERGPHILGGVEKLPELRAEYVIGVNSSSVRAEIDRRCVGVLAATLIHPTAVVGTNIVGDEGVVLAANVVLTTNIIIGRHAHLNVGASVNQGSVIGNYVTLSPGVRVCGDCVISNGAELGAGSTVINLKTVGEFARVGAGACVVNDIPPISIVKGVPAR